MGNDIIIRLSACFTLIIGAIECFAGYKIMKPALPLSGFLIGVAVGAALGVVSDSVVLGVIFILLLGFGAGFLSYKVYYIGVFILVSFLMGLAVYMPGRNLIPAASAAIAAGVLSVLFTKPTVISVSSFGGAGIIISSAYIMMGLGFGFVRDSLLIITIILWIPVTLSGLLCQTVTTRRVRNPVIAQIKQTDDSLSFSEQRYPGMQRAYRNYCIKCGLELHGVKSRCPRCNFGFDD